MTANLQVMFPVAFGITGLLISLGVTAFRWKKLNRKQRIIGSIFSLIFLLQLYFVGFAGFWSQSGAILGVLMFIVYGLMLFQKLFLVLAIIGVCVVAKKWKSLGQNERITAVLILAVMLWLSFRTLGQ